MSDNKRLDKHGLEYFWEKIQQGSAGILYGTTAYWNSHPDLIPPRGKVVVYSDYAHEEDELGNTINIPNIKIADGLAYLIDQPFVSDDLRQAFNSHIADTNTHIQVGEREFWNNKVNVDDVYEQTHAELQNETLVITRN